MLAFSAILLSFCAAVWLFARHSGLTVRAAIRHRAAMGLSLAFVAILLAAWWLATTGERIEDRALSPLILPSPVEVLSAFPQLHLHQGLVRNAMLSFERVAIGFSLATALAITLGVSMAAFPPVRAFFKPLELMAAYVPIVVFVPLTLAWWGIDETQKIGFLFIACFVAMLPAVFKTISDIPDAYLDVAMTKGASQWQLVRKVMVPVAMADIWDHMRTVYGVGWGWIIIAEMVAAKGGVGYLMNQSQRRSNIAAVFAIIVVIVLIAAVCDYAWQAGGKLLFPYRNRK